MMKLRSYRHNAWYACLCLAGCLDIVCRCRVIKSHFLSWGLWSRHGGAASLSRCWWGRRRARRRFHFLDGKDPATSSRDSGHILHLPHPWYFLEFHCSRKNQQERMRPWENAPMPDQRSRWGKEVADFKPHVIYVLIVCKFEYSYYPMQQEPSPRNHQYLSTQAWAVPADPEQHLS